ncbi:MAG: monooxygenase [Alcaligenaceae bacterium]|nr:MAG: monooxygenase [Alcaligenaceae bacterium]
MPHSDFSSIRARLEGANPVPLAMSLIHLTGDLSLLEHIVPHIRGAWEHLESIPPALAADIRERMAACMVEMSKGGTPAMAQPSSQGIQKMMSAAVGEQVSEAYVPMLLEQVGLRVSDQHMLGLGRSVDPASRTDSGKRTHSTGRIDPASAAHSVAQDTSHEVNADITVCDSQSSPKTNALHVVIIGAGASGLCAAIHLGKLGIPYTIFEKNAEVGGTWYENRYPGCAVDTPNHFYQFSFEPNNNWPNYFSQRNAIQAYLEHCADKYEVRQHIRFNTEVSSVVFDEATQTWSVQASKKTIKQTTDDTDRVEYIQANAVICAVGQLNRPAIPKLPGLEQFQGQVVHTAQWPEHLDVKGKKIALIGTGASAVQVGPAIAAQVESLAVLQRSGSWVVRRPNIDGVVSEDTKWVLNNVPFYAPWYRFQLFWAFGDGLFEALKIDPTWQGGSESISAFNARLRESMMKHIRRELAGRDDLLKKVVPDFPPFGKRVLGDAGWYSMLKRDNVRLETGAIKQVHAKAIELEDDTLIEADILVMATGFQAGRMLWPMDIQGRGGVTIRQKWGDDDPRAFLGITAPEFPNFFMMYGPNTNIGHGGSALFLAECQTRYFMGLIQALRNQPIRSVECRQEVHDRYNQEIDRLLGQLSWSHPSVSTWYKNAKGRIVTNQPWSLLDYWRLTYAAKLSDYHLIS